MFKLMKRLIFIAFILTVVLLALSLWQGGTPFRWFGEKSEQAGIIMKETSEELGNEADKIKKKTDAIQKSTREVSEGLKKTGEKVRELAGSKDEN
jgi:hypothetical protein